MRIDKYLWCIRVYKTRSLATEACRENRVVVDEAPVKPAREIKKNEEISIRKGAVTFRFKVLDLPKSRVGAALVPEYAKDTTPESELEKLQMIKEGHNQRPRGVGRPTKRDRRDIDRFFT